MKHTQNLVKVSRALADRPDERRWGYDLSQAAGVRSGVLYPMLHRMMEQGWLTDGWEDPATIRGRPPRRYYVLTDHGQHEAQAVVERADRESAR